MDLQSCAVRPIIVGGHRRRRGRGYALPALEPSLWFSKNPDSIRNDSFKTIAFSTVLILSTYLFVLVSYSESSISFNAEIQWCLQKLWYYIWEALYLKKYKRQDKIILASTKKDVLRYADVTPIRILQKGFHSPRHLRAPVPFLSSLKYVFLT